MTRSVRLAAAALAALVAGPVLAQEVVFKDPVGDDHGPGKYLYPTDPVYKKGSFDLTELKVTQQGDKVTFAVSVNSDLEDPWSMPVPANFSVQEFFVFVQTGKGGFTKGIPGLNVQFAPEDAWNKCVIMSPQPAGRVRAEAKQKAADLLGGIVVPNETIGKGRTISATVDKKDLGEGDIAKWGYQIVVQSNEGFPDKTDLLTRKVNEYEGQHRFGGGNDGDCDPHAMDVLAGKGTGDKSEIEAQHQMLAYECNPDGSSKKMATLKMVRK
ncbi:MAG TPA: glucodextranase DOMON-like domain-containing protein [Anaeromyxobacteraceae bacterium]|nr:glucodextranase DOMON-like domain-containing protein [Anaeromyxobacteraceae bacterium]